MVHFKPQITPIHKKTWIPIPQYNINSLILFYLSIIHSFI